MTLRYLGGGVIDPLTDWATVIELYPRRLPRDVLNACERAIGQLEGVAEDEELAASATSLGLAELHPLMWCAARKLWSGGHLRQAVEGAYSALLGHVNELTSHPDGNDDGVFGRAFAKNPADAGAPRLRWPGDQRHRTVVSMINALKHLSLGV